MARAISDRTNTDAPSGNFTHGRVRNNDGSGNGTPNNEALHGDWTQFFEKLMRDNGVTPNGNPDDQVTNQIYQSLLNFDNRNNGTLKIANLTQWGNAITQIISTTVYSFNTNLKSVFLDIGSSPTDEIVTLATNIPLGEVISFFSSGSIVLILNSTATSKPIKLSGNVTPNDTYGVSGNFTLTNFDEFFLLTEH